MKAIAAALFIGATLMGPARADEQRLGPTGGDGGTPFTERISTGSRMHSIQVNAGRYVDGIRFTYETADGQIHQRSIGGRGGTSYDVYPLSRGVRVVGISGRSGKYIDSIRFHFSDGTTSPEYGGADGGTSYELILPKAADGKFVGQVVGFFGRADRLLDQIGVLHR